jgi:hypothetical protein
MRALVLLDVAACMRSRSRARKCSPGVCAGHVHIEGDVAAQQVEWGLAVHAALTVQPEFRPLLHSIVLEGATGQLSVPQM